MELLLTLDERNYTREMPIKEVFTARAIIERDGKYAMQRSRAGWYKIPGGGIEPGETYLETLAREIQEEVGLVLIPDSVQEIGEILELREDRKCAGQKFVRHSLYYFCRVTGDTVATDMTASERALGFQPAWATPEEIIRCNESLGYTDRDTEFLKILSRQLVPV